MAIKRTRSFFLFSLLVLLMVTGCSRKQETLEIKKRYDLLVDEVIDTYRELHPLTSSRLGIYGADSLLFTFSEPELKAGRERIRELLDELSGLPAGRLDERERDDSILLLHWLKGELFAMEKLKLHQHNPLLYCWMIEEALFGLPSRIESPHEGERAAYEKRLLRIPQLLENAEEHLEKPSEHHIRYTLERLDRLIDSFGELKTLTEERYGEHVASLVSVRRSIEAFKRFIADALSTQTRGRLILGAENLSHIYLYDEHLDLDLNGFAREAEKNIGKLRNQATTIRLHLANTKRQTAPTTENAERIEHVVSHLIDEIDGSITAKKLFKVKPTTKPDIVSRRFPGFFLSLPDNPYLTIPPSLETELAVIHSSCLSPLPCRSHVVVPETAAAAEDPALFFQLMRASSPVRRIGTDLCEQCDSVRSLLQSETFRAAWYIHTMGELIKAFPERKQELELLLTERTIRDLARVVIVFRLHSGAFTSEAAIEYFAQTVNVTRTEAEREVIRASVSPSLAYPGIAALYAEQMLKRFAQTRGVRDPRMEMSKLFLDQNGLPLTILMDKIPEE